MINQRQQILYRLSNLNTEQKNILSQEIGAVDLIKETVSAKYLVLTYTALYSRMKKVNELSLVNFFR